MAAANYWRCPVCHRRVPRTVVECYCGRIRQASDGPDPAPRRQGPPLLPFAIVAVLLLAGSVAWWMRSGPAPTQEGSARLAATNATGASPSAASTPSPPPAPTPTPLSGAALAYDVAARHIQWRMTQLEAQLSHLERSCGPGSRLSSCDTLRDAATTEAQGIREAVAAAEAAARQAFLDGPFQLETRNRYRIGEGNVTALLSRARAAVGRAP